MVDLRHGGSATEHRHVVVAYPGYHRSWATWLCARLEAHGYRATPHRWDPSREQPLQEALGDLLLASGRVLLVLSDWFFQLGPRREGEWNAVLRDFVAQRKDRFAAVNLTNRTLLPATAVLEPVDLWSVGEPEAERRLLDRLDITPAPGARPFDVPYPNDPVPVWSAAVPRRNGQFTGRDVLLNDVQQRLTDSGPGAAVCALVGMSGVGKTQAAAEYAHRFSPDYDLVWWVNSDQRNTLRDSLGELAVELGLTTSPEVGDRIRAVREALRRGRPYDRWLLIFDGWEEADEAAAYLPSGGHGHVLITSRNRSWSGVADTVEVNGFARHESTGYLLRRAPHLTGEEADQVATEFEDMPIYLAQAAAWLGQSEMDAREYLRMVRGRAPGQPHGPAGHVEGLPDSTLTSWSILLNKLRTSEPRTVELLILCTAFAPGRIPLGLVRGAPAADLPENLRWIISDRSRWARAMDSLVNYSVLTRGSRSVGAHDGGPEQESVHMHRLVHGIVGALTEGDDRETYRRVVRRLLAAADPGSPTDSRNWSRYAELLPHLTASGSLTSRDGRSQALLLKCLRYAKTSGEYRVGAELAERLRDEWSRFMAPDDAEMLELTTLQGNILRSAGRFREAHELDTARLDRLLRAADAPEEALLRARSCLAADQRFLGHYGEAFAHQEQVVAEADRLFGPDEWLTLLARHNLGGCLRLLGRYAAAYEVDLETFRKRESLLRSRHPDTLSSGNTCARDLRLMGRYQEALARQELGVRRHVQVLGPQHPNTLWARHNLAMCERRAGTARDRLGTEMAVLLEQQEQISGRTHFSVLSIIADYANYLREHGDLAQAKDLVAEAEDGYRSLLGPAHPVSTGMQSNVGLVLQAAGDRDGALNMFEQALVGLRTLLGDDHPATLGCALNAAAGRNFTGRLEGAEALSRDTLRRTRRALGEDHPLTLSCQIALASDLRSLRERAEAGKLEEDALQRLTRSLGAQHPHTLSARQRVRPYWDYEPYLG